MQRNWFGREFWKNSLRCRSSVFSSDERNFLEMDWIFLSLLLIQFIDKLQSTWMKKSIHPPSLINKRSLTVMMKVFDHLAEKTGEEICPYPICMRKRHNQEIHARNNDSRLSEQPVAAIVESLQSIARCQNSSRRQILEISVDLGWIV